MNSLRDDKTVKSIYHNDDHYMQWGMRPLHKAALNNSKECLELLLSHRADVNAKNLVSNHAAMN